MTIDYPQRWLREAEAVTSAEGWRKQMTNELLKCQKGLELSIDPSEVETAKSGDLKNISITETIGSFPLFRILNNKDFYYNIENITSDNKSGTLYYSIAGERTKLLDFVAKPGVNNIKFKVPVAANSSEIMVFEYGNDQAMVLIRPELTIQNNVAYTLTGTAITGPDTFSISDTEVTKIPFSFTHTSVPDGFEPLSYEIRVIGTNPLNAVFENDYIVTNQPTSPMTNIVIPAKVVSAQTQFVIDLYLDGKKQNIEETITVMPNDSQ